MATSTQSNRSLIPTSAGSGNGAVTTATANTTTAATATAAPAYIISWTRNANLPTIALPPMSAFLAGAVAGAASRTVVSPLERLKIILQVQGPSRQYPGVLGGLAKMWKEEGFRGYMRGNGINCIRIAPYSAVQFSSYELFKSLLTANGSEIDTPRRLIAGSLAGICSVVTTYPLDLVRSRLSIESASLGGESAPATMKNTGIVAMTLRVYREEGGFRGLYRGLSPTALGVAPYVAGNFAVYEILRGWMSNSSGEPPGTLGKLLAGALAGSISQTLTYPLDVLRRRMQVAGLKSMGYAYNTTWEAVVHLVKGEGLRGLYKGLIPNLLKVGPSIGTSFAVYEKAKEMLESHGVTRKDTRRV